MSHIYSTKCSKCRKSDNICVCLPPELVGASVIDYGPTFTGAVESRFAFPSFPNSYKAQTANLASQTGQPAPIKNDEPASWDLVISRTEEDRKEASKDKKSVSGYGDLIAAMRDRDNFGASKYGVRLQAKNGRDHLVDALDEVLDGCVYIENEWIERPSLELLEIGKTLRDVGLKIVRMMQSRR